MRQNCRSLEMRMKKPDLPDVLAGISPHVFMRDYWQKKPLLIRQAWTDFPELIDFARQGKLDLSNSISEILPLAQAAEAIDKLANKIGNPIRIVLKP